MGLDFGYPRRDLVSWNFNFEWESGLLELSSGGLKERVQNILWKQLIEA